MFFGGIDQPISFDMGQDRYLLPAFIEPLLKDSQFYTGKGGESRINKAEIFLLDLHFLLFYTFFDVKKNILRKKGERGGSCP
jgi:hypothetical protein